MRKKIASRAKIQVHVYLQPDLTPIELAATKALSDSICGMISISCESIKQLPLVLLPDSSNEELSCEDGWELVYTLDDSRRAEQFAKYASLLAPVCGVIVKNGGGGGKGAKSDRRESSVRNRWVKPLRGDHIVFSDDTNVIAELPEDLFD